MCGIVGGIESDNIVPLLTGGLARLEYRGYDSAGLAVSNGDEPAQRRVTVARAAALRQLAAALSGGFGIGHTRWATHGAPSEANAHPLRAGRVLVAHNGIIENHADLRAELVAAGRQFSSDTDSEVIAHLMDIALARGDDLLAAWQACRQRLRGAYAVALMADGAAEMIAARHGSPLLVGEGARGVYIASDLPALAGAVQRVHYMEDGECALLRRGQALLYNENGEQLPAAFHPVAAQALEVQLGEYMHFMQKEIFEQPDAVAATMQAHVQGIVLRRFGSGAAPMFRRVKQVRIVACGTSYHAGLIAGMWMEKFAIPCRVDIASEYRYRAQPQAAESLLIAVSQSGETADTLSALRGAQAAGAPTLAVVNNAASSMPRQADYTFCTRAGPEIGVASTKAFTAQLTALLLLTLAIARARRLLPPPEEQAVLQQLKRLPYLLRKALLLQEAATRWARELAAAKSIIYIGRRMGYPLALEGALKLKEISYIHAEGGAAGELKHGSLALVDSDLPVIALAPDDDLLEKTTANLAEVAARGGQLYVIAGRRFMMKDLPPHRIIRIADDGGEFLSPMVYVVVLQLLAYYTARQKGTDIDKPRNLAKAVTVE